MYYITGDMHRKFQRVEALCDGLVPGEENVLIILGDAAINSFDAEKDRRLKDMLAALPIRLFCIHGNHERRPQSLPSYRESVWKGGTVYVEKDFPNLLFAKDGEIYDLDGKRCIVIGGAYSVNKEYLLKSGRSWWADEQPDDTVKRFVEAQLASCGNRIDYVFTHTCPLRYEPREAFKQGVDASKVDKSTETWLDGLEEKLCYEKWYCGHYHIEKRSGKMRFLFESIRMLGE